MLKIQIALLLHNMLHQRLGRESGSHSLEAWVEASSM
jgi:hypothetical protein